jgi:membrane-associated protein
VEFINEAVLHAAGQWWIYPVLLVFFFVDGFAMVVPSETLIVALAAFSRHSGEPNLWILGATALVWVQPPWWVQLPVTTWPSCWGAGSA